MSTDCYAVVFEDGSVRIVPVCQHAVDYSPKSKRWELFDFSNNPIYSPISQVWHCPSPASAAQILRELGKGYHKDLHDSYIASCDAALICRNPAPKENP